MNATAQLRRLSIATIFALVVGAGFTVLDADAASQGRSTDSYGRGRGNDTNDQDT